MTDRGGFTEGTNAAMHDRGGNFTQYGTVEQEPVDRNITGRAQRVVDDFSTNVNQMAGLANEEIDQLRREENQKIACEQKKAQCAAQCAQHQMNEARQDARQTFNTRGHPVIQGQ